MVISAPLRPWVWCVFWLGLIGLLLVWLVDTRPVKITYYRDYSHPAASVVSADNKCAAVLGLGDSLLGRSVPDAVLIRKILGDDVCWISIWKSGGMASEFVDLKELQPSTKTTYQLLLIQDSLLTQRHVPFNLKAREALRQLMLNDILGISYTDGKITDEIPIPPTKFLSQKEIHDRVEGLRSNYLVSIPLSQQSLKFLKHLKSIAKYVVVLHLPRSGSLESGVQQEQKRWLDYLDEQLSAIGINVVVLGNPLPDDHYYDGSHTNGLGQAVRLQQFSQLMKEHL